MMYTLAKWVFGIVVIAGLGYVFVNIGKLICARWVYLTPGPVHPDPKALSAFHICPNWNPRCPRCRDVN